MSFVLLEGRRDTRSFHAGCYIITGAVDDWHARLVTEGIDERRTDT
jgi:hypothetical protein